MRASDIPTEDLAGILDTLIQRLWLQIVREQTPDYTSYELHSIEGGKGTTG